MILMNTAPASQGDLKLLRDELGMRFAPHQEKLNALHSSAKYAEGDPDTEAEYHRIRYSTTMKRPEHLETLIKQMRLSFTNQGILQSRAIEDQLYVETWRFSGYDLYPKLKQLHISTLVIHGDHDFVPVDCATHIAQAIPGAQLVLLENSGHFAYLESPDDVRQVLADFFGG